MPSTSNFEISTDLLAQFLDNASQDICVCTPSGQLVYANKSFKTTFKIKDTQKTSLHSLFRDFDFPAVIANLEERNKHNTEVEFSTTDSNGNFLHYQIKVDYHEPDSYCLFFKDITIDKNRERDLLESQQQLNTVLDNIPAYVYFKDRKGTYTYANKMLSMLHALHVDDIIGKSDFDIYPEETAKTFIRNDEKVFEQKKIVRALEYGGKDEYGIERSYLSVKCPIFNEDNDVESILGMSIDISEQQRLEKSLLDSDEKLNTILDNLKARVFIKDRNFKYTYANEELCQELKLDRATIIGKDDYDLFNTKTAIAYRAVDEKVFETNQKVSNMTTSYRDDGLEDRHFLSIKVPLFDINGKAHSLLGISTDISEQVRMEKKLRQNENRLTAILDNLKAHVYIKDINSRYTYVNTNICEYLGRPKEEVIGKTDSEVFGEKAAHKFHKSDNHVFNYRETHTSIEKSTHYQTRKKCYFLSVKAPLINELGNPYALLGISTDVTEQKRLEKQLRKMASTDVLTGVNNRRHFLELCSKEIKRAKRYNTNLSLIMLDMDHFKHINDTLGHAAGDDAIRAMTKICKNSLRDIDVIGRIGGEEFAIMLPETGLEGALHIAERIRQTTEKNIIKTSEGKSVRFTASFGVTALREKDETPDDMLKRADIALYDAKTSGRNRICEK